VLRGDQDNHVTLGANSNVQDSSESRGSDALDVGTAE